MPAPSAASASVPSLRFPKPQGSQRLANWISSSSPDIMAQAVPIATMDDDAMADFELINTDGETESLASSVDLAADRLARPDDMVSLASTDNTNDREDYTHDPDFADEHDHGDRDGVLLGPTTQQGEAPPPNHSQPNELYIRPHGTIWASHSPQGPSRGRHLHLIERDSTDRVAAESTPTLPAPGKELAMTSTPAQLFRDMLDGPCIEQWRRLMRLVLATLLFGGLLHVVLPAYRATHEEVGFATPSVHDHPTPITVVATPATVTVTVTSTSTVRLDSIQDLARRIAGTADDAMRNVEAAFAPALVSLASNLWHDTTDSIKAAGQAVSWETQADMICHLRDSIATQAMRIRTGASQTVARHFKDAEALRDDLSFNVLKAQIKSWLICLQLRGDTLEYQRYEARAAKHLGAKHREMMEKRSMADRVPSGKASRRTNWRWTNTG